MAILKSQPRATSNPPPIQTPLIAAIIGLGVFSILSAKPCIIGSNAFFKFLSFTSDKSEPEANAFLPSPVNAITFTLLSLAD